MVYGTCKLTITPYLQNDAKFYYSPRGRTYKEKGNGYLLMVGYIRSGIATNMDRRNVCPGRRKQRCRYTLQLLH